MIELELAFYFTLKKKLRETVELCLRPFLLHFCMHEQNIRTSQRETLKMGKMDLFYSKGLLVVETFEIQVIFKRRSPSENAPPPTTPVPNPHLSPRK